MTDIFGDPLDLRWGAFDMECRPIAWYGGDFVTKQPTAIAWKEIGTRSAITVIQIGLSFDTRKTLDEEREMLLAFVDFYNSMDGMTGHFIRGFDLPLANGALMRLGLPTLKKKLTLDTKLDFLKGQGISKSQENLGAMYELKHPKIPMNTHKWLEANCLMPEGLELTRKRVIGDVRQFIEMRALMLQRRQLSSPKVWNPGGGGPAAQYSA